MSILWLARKISPRCDYVAKLLNNEAARQAGITDVATAEWMTHADIVDCAEEPPDRNRHSPPAMCQQETAFVSIMQGCKIALTFCIVPQEGTRGAGTQPFAERDRKEVRDMVSRGVKEVTY